MFACGLRQWIACHYEWFFISSLTFDLHWTPQETRKPDYIFCQNDSKRLRGTGAFLNSAIILKLVWHEKVNLYFEIIFFQKPLLFPSKVWEARKIPPAETAKFFLQVKCEQRRLNFSHPRRLNLSYERMPFQGTQLRSLLVHETASLFHATMALETSRIGFVFTR